MVETLQDSKKRKGTPQNKMSQTEHNKINNNERDSNAHFGDIHGPEQLSHNSSYNDYHHISINTRFQMIH